MNILTRFYPEFDSEDLTKEKIYLLLYPGKKFKESVMNTVLSGLNQMCEEYLIYLDIKNNPQRDMRLLRQFCKRGHKSRADKLYHKLKDQISRPGLTGLDYFERLEILDSIDNYYVSYDKRKLRYLHLQKSLLNLDYFFILQTLTFQKEILSGTFFTDDLPEKSLPLRLLIEINLDKLISIINIEDPENSILLKIYFLIVKNLSKEFDEKEYNRLKKLILENIIVLDFQSAKILLLNLQIIITKRLNEGRSEFEKELYEISKILIDGSFYDNEKSWFRASHFRAIVKLGINQNDLEYTEKFIEKYYKKLEPGIRMPLKHFAVANILFAKKKYDEALNNLVKTDFDNILFKIDSKRLTAKIYYETNSTENLLHFLDSFSHYLRSISSSDKTIIGRNINFIKYLKSLIKFKESKSASFEIKDLKNKISKENVSDINWILQKISEISVQIYKNSMRAM